MALVQAQVRMARTTELPEDVVINTFAFTTPTAGNPSAAEMDSIIQGLSDFYNLATAGSRTVASYLSPLLLGGINKHEVRLYRIDAALNAPPVRSQAFNILTGGNPPLPAEVAVCLSFKAQPNPPINPARRRGRIYIGPLTTEVVTAAVTGDARPQALLLTTLTQAGKRLADRLEFEWSVYSRSSGIVAPIAELWADNAFDTQRRRGAKATSRVTLAAALA